MTETQLPNDWTLITTEHGSHRAHRFTATAQLRAFDYTWTERPRVDWSVFDATGEIERRKGKAATLDAAMAAADEALAALEGGVR